jgi:hypothetical protein
MIGPMVLRGALVLVALLAIGWFGVLYRDRRVGQAAADVIFYQPGLPAAEFERQLERLRGARLLDPDRYWDFTRARYLLLRDRPVRALRTANGLVRAEPDNLDAWIIVHEAALEVDPRRAARALTEISRLNPRLSGRR